MEGHGIRMMAEVFGGMIKMIIGSLVRPLEKEVFMAAITELCRKIYTYSVARVSHVAQWAKNVQKIPKKCNIQHLPAKFGSTVRMGLYVFCTNPSVGRSGSFGCTKMVKDNF